jgi:hypothetical protein
MQPAGQKMKHHPHWRHFSILVTGLCDRHSPVLISRGSFGVDQGPSNVLMNFNVFTP